MPSEFIKVYSHWPIANTSLQVISGYHQPLRLLLDLSNIVDALAKGWVARNGRDAHSLGESVDERLLVLLDVAGECVGHVGWVAVLKWRRSNRLKQRKAS